MLKYLYTKEVNYGTKSNANTNSDTYAAHN